MGRLLRYIQQSTGLDGRDIVALAARAPSSYKVYCIPKRMEGYRIIAQPAREIKFLQRFIQDYLSDLPIHVAATAYKKGSSIRTNAAVHSGSGPILKLDFRNFFPSIKAVDWVTYCRRRATLEEDDINLSARLLFYRPARSTILRLSIGAPTSPWLSNVLMFDFDAHIADTVARDKVRYTRYADDLTFSGRRTGHLVNVPSQVRAAIAEMKHPSLTLNEAKTVLATSKYKRFVTGLVLSDDGRVTIGRERKREIRAALHHAFHGHLDQLHMGKLAGLLAYVQSVEPEYIQALNLTYGFDVTKSLLSGKAEAP